MSEELILTNLIVNDPFTRKVLPFLRKSYFQLETNKLIFDQYVRYFSKYNASPTAEVLAHEIAERQDISDEVFSELEEAFEALVQDEIPNFEWLCDTTEAFCQERAIYNAIQKAINIIDDPDDTTPKHAIPDLLKDALAVSFDTHIGHNYLEDSDERFEFYNMDHPRIPFDIEMLNKITNGGCPRKTLNVLLGTTNVGKTLGLVHLSTAYLNLGYNVLYVTAEMSEEAIGNRIDANQFQINVNDVLKLDKETFDRKINQVKSKTTGKLIIKEYPTSTAHTGHIKTLLQDLKLKKNFVPDVICVDYINIMASARVNLANTGSYFYIKAIAEELRALAVETNSVLWTATQSNRGGANNSDVDLTDTAESFGLPATADFMLALIRTDELDLLNQLLMKQLKSRYGNKSYYEKFCIGSDINTMTWYDIEESAQQLEQNTPVSENNKHDKVKDFVI